MLARGQEPVEVERIRVLGDCGGQSEEAGRGTAHGRPATPGRGIGPRTARSGAGPQTERGGAEPGGPAGREAVAGGS